MTTLLPPNVKVPLAFETDKRRIVEEAARPGASVAEVAKRYGIDRRILCRWKQALAPPIFVAVEVTKRPPE